MTKSFTKTHFAGPVCLDVQNRAAAITYVGIWLREALTHRQRPRNLFMSLESEHASLCFWTLLSPMFGCDTSPKSPVNIPWQGTCQNHWAVELLR